MVVVVMDAMRIFGQKKYPMVDIRTKVRLSKERMEINERIPG